MDEKILKSGADASDYAVAQVPAEEQGYPFLRGAKGETPEAMNYQDAPLDNYEKETGIPYLAARLGYGQNVKVDPMVEMKVRAIDEHVRSTMQKEGMTNSKTAFETVLRRMAESLGESLEGAKNHGSLTKLLDSLFMQVSFANGMSSKTFLAHYRQKYLGDRTNNLLRELGQHLSMLKVNP